MRASINESRAALCAAVIGTATDPGVWILRWSGYSEAPVYRGCAALVE
jgi:hypothetical protein